LKVLITGADGFVGRAVCRRLLEIGLIPRAGLWNAGLWSALKAATPGLDEFATIGDLGAGPDFRSAFEDVSAVVHLAARVHIMHDNALDPLAEFRRVNTGGTVALARAAAAAGVRRFVFVSTVKVNGESTVSLRASPFFSGSRVGD
jgi:nucleoside-diphosphate-sugar epimerase